MIKKIQKKKQKNKMQTAILELSNDTSGIFLTLASSLACVLGALIITLDLIWRKIFPSSKFDLHNNQGFLVCSLSLSAGVLIFTAFFKLMPQALEYFGKSPKLKDSPSLAMQFLIITFLVGVITCACINMFIHAFTSKSIVHCAHDGDHHHDNESEESNGSLDLNQNPFAYSPPQSESHLHTHSHSHTHTHTHSDSPSRSHSPSQMESYTGCRSSTDISSHDMPGPLDTSDVCKATKSAVNSAPLTCTRIIRSETTPLLARTASSATLDTTNYTGTETKSLLKKKSIVDITQWTFRGKKSIGKCMGFDNVETCCGKCKNINGESIDAHDIIDYIEPETMSHRHLHLDQAKSRTHSYSSTNLDQQVICQKTLSEPTIHSHSHRAASTGTPEQANSAGHVHTHEGDEELGLDKDEIHHHHVSTRYSHLFSIGMQTAFAISVHKIPEGFLTFATTHADRELGFSVFVALAVHNISEGFTIAFPLFLALQSRTLAIGLAVVLGGLSQPLGALLAWAVFGSGLLPGGDDAVTDEKAQLVFGLIVSITSGFLAIIGLQMYGTAISVGGSQHTTMMWAFLGIAIIGLAGSLSSHH